MKNRNSKCSCGSGKKYKKCCWEQDRNLKVVSRQLQAIQFSYLEAYSNLYDYATKRDDFAKIVNDASKKFFPIEVEYTNDIRCIFNSYLLKDFVLEDSHRTILVDYYVNNKNKLSSEEAYMLSQMSKAYLSLYTIESINTKTITLYDKFLDKKVDIINNGINPNIKVNNDYIISVLEINNVYLSTEIFFEVADSSLIERLQLYLEYNLASQTEKFDNFEDFLRKSTLIFYYHVLQLLDPSTIPLFKEIFKIEDEKNMDLKDNPNEALDDDKKVYLSADTFNLIDRNNLVKVLNLVEEVTDSNSLNSKTELGWVCAAEYFIKKENGEKITQTEVASKYNISTSTLSRRYKEIKSIK